MIEYGKYHILEGIYPRICLHISLLTDDNIHNIKLIYRYISNNDDPVKTLLTFCGVYHGNRPDIKGNPPYNFYALRKPSTVGLCILYFDANIQYLAIKIMD